MRNFKSVIVICLVILLLISVTGCGGKTMQSNESATLAATMSPTATTTPEPTSQIKDIGESFNTEVLQIITQRVSALETKDYDLYMSTIGVNNQFYFNEQERWFMNMIDDKISDIALDVVSTQMLDENTAVANIKQHHVMDKPYVFEYPLLFKYEDGSWMDYGYNFEEYKADRFVVKYMDGEDRLDEFVQMLDEAFDYLAGVYELKPLDNYEMKLFSDQEMLRQRCIPANAWLFTGWSEPDESLKIYTGQPYEYDEYSGVVQHELVHHITIRMCNNNMPVWLLEGIAMYDGSAHFGIENSKMLRSMSKTRVSQTIADLEKNDLSTDLSTQQIFNYYSTSYMYVRYIMETYGRKAFVDLLLEAGKKPFHDSTLNESFEANNIKTADEVILTVLGLTKEELSQGYLEWVEDFDFSNVVHDINREKDADIQQSTVENTVMIIIGNQFGNTYFTMKEALENQGFKVVTAGVGKGEMLSSCPNHEDVPVAPDINIEDVNEENIADFAVVFIPAGKHHRTIQYNKDVERVLNLCQSNDVYISAVCAANIVLAACDGLIDGHEIAASSFTKSVIEGAGGICSYKNVVVDGLLVTGRNSGQNVQNAPVEEMAQVLKDLIASR